ncbi:cobalamin biosynthesis protein CobD [Thiopseudomonas alkaliphila]|uniref:adenosylcobinamide-phosphate synthase CbiB n=1 Tax=Thiopseudomonas alkaliphila TaxID=1697053 RepID=UPI00069F9105|nr:cobalamin biosynthesis protein CobD [Thiopseudomonas alkaliphila]
MAAVFAIFLTCAIALLLDLLLGEPKKWHPLVGFGRLAHALESRLNLERYSAKQRLVRGGIALLLLTLPVLAGLIFLSAQLSGFWLMALNSLILWLAIALRSLREHGLAVAVPLQNNDLAQAQQQVSRIVSRQTSALDQPAVAAAATESILENGADAVFASLFWFIVAGAPGVVLHRLVNTLDAMWGYRTPRFLYFGRCAARLDDLLGWLPARLTALTYCLLGQRRSAWHCWQQQAKQWDSPNAGPVMASGAGALQVRLGGPAPYFGGIKQRPWLGTQQPASAASIYAAITLIRRGTWLWLAVLAGLCLLSTLGGS